MERQGLYKLKSKLNPSEIITLSITNGERSWDSNILKGRVIMHCIIIYFLTHLNLKILLLYLAHLLFFCLSWGLGLTKWPCTVSIVRLGVFFIFSKIPQIYEILSSIYEWDLWSFELKDQIIKDKYNSCKTYHLVMNVNTSSRSC